MIFDGFNTYRRKFAKLLGTRYFGLLLLFLAITLLGVSVIHQSVFKQTRPIGLHEDFAHEDRSYQQPFETSSTSSLNPTSMDVYQRFDDYLETGQSKSYTVYLYSDHMYDIDLDLNTTNTSVDFELEIRDPSNQLVDYTEHATASHGIDVSLDIICLTRGSWSVAVISENGNSSNLSLPRG